VTAVQARGAGRGLLRAGGLAVGLGTATVVGALVEAHAFRLVTHAVTLPQTPVEPVGTAVRMPVEPVEAALAGALSATSTGVTDPGTTRRLRILHLSDLHYVPGQLDKLRFLSGLDDLAPDLVICTGDLLSDDAGIDELTGALAGLLRRPGAFVFGSNDYFGPRPGNPLRYLVPHERTLDGARALDWRTLRDVLAGAGWADLHNRRAAIATVGIRLELRGTGDAHIDLDDYAQVAGPAASGIDLVLGVTHAPYRRVLDAMVHDGLPLILAGHTHGGQVCLPGWGALVSNCDLPPKLASGLHWYAPEHTPVSLRRAQEPLGGGAGTHRTPGERAEAASGAAAIAPGDPQVSAGLTNGAWLHVSAGLGTSPYAPFRLFCRPEACLLDVAIEDAG